MGRWIKIGDFIRNSVPFQGKITFTSRLRGKLIRKNGEIIDLGVLCRKVVTDDFADLLIDIMQNLGVSINTFKYHDSGTGTTAAVAADSALEVPTGLAKVVGTQTEGASSKIYKTVGTITYDAEYAITEQGVFNSANVLLDRHTFSLIGVQSGDKIEFDYEFTCNSGG